MVVELLVQGGLQLEISCKTRNEKLKMNLFTINIIFTGREHKVLPDHRAGLAAWLGGGVPAKEKDKRVKKCYC